jgi:hypothetical protein
MSNALTKSNERTCKWCDKPLKKDGDWDGVCSSSCGILSGEKMMSEEHFETMFSFMRSGGFDEVI